jgi:hypothetical protein
MMISNLKETTVECQPEQRFSKACVWLLLVLTIMAFAACYPAHYRTVPQPMPAETASAGKSPMAQLYFYPKSGQSNEQQSRDHFECYNWAVKQTGFDPGQSAIPKDQRVRVVPMPPPGHDTAALAIAGAVLGALIGGPRHAVGGALIGASGGVIAGAASDSARMESARQREEAYAAQDRIRDVQLEAKAVGFQRAMSACMEGRGYSVR